jgi:M6 family metalloprotease-like protein
MGPGRSKLHRALLVVSLGLLVVVGAGLAIRWSRSEPTKRSEPEYVSRPLVTLLLKCPGPTAPKDQQYRNVIIEVDKPIPDGPAPGLESDLVLPAGADQVFFDLGLNLTMNHPRAAEVKIAISAVSPDGKTILKTQVLWDGPAAARGKSVAEADHLECRIETHPNELLSVRGCRRWRFTVTDASPGNVGHLKKWGLGCRIARFPFAHDQESYRRLLFGDGQTRDPLRAPNAADYFREISRGKATYTDAGVFGPMLWDGWDGSSDPEQCAAAVRLLEAQGFDFRPFDTDHNGIVTINELTVLVIQNDGDGHDGRTRVDPGGTVLERIPLRVQPAIVFVPQQFDFKSLTHELSHALVLGHMVDLYGAWSKECRSEGLTLMSCTLSTPPDDKSSIYLDPWHRTRFGWLGRFDPGTADRAELGSEAWVDARGARSHPMIVRKPGGDGSEYYLFEFRDGSGYDNGVGDRGIVAWHVREDGKGAPIVGEGTDNSPGHAIYAVGPDSERGGRRAWKISDGQFRLRWADGSLLPATYWVEALSIEKGSAILRWSATPESRSPKP